MHPLFRHTTKFYPRARKSIFLGYKSGYKGYVLFDPHSQNLFIFRNVVFDEQIIPHVTNPSFPTSDWNYKICYFVL